MNTLPVLTVPLHLWSALRDDLLTSPHLERAAVGFAGLTGEGEALRLLLRDWMPVPESEYLVQLAYHLEVSPAFWARAAKRARDTGEALIIAHSHPHGDGPPAFSASDDGGEAALVPKLQERADVPVAAIVVGPAGHRSRISLPGSARVRMTTRVVGAPNGTRRQVATHATHHDREVRALGRDGHAAIAALTISVVGAGGLGSHVVQQLLHLGVGRVIVVDPDVMAKVNLSRVVGGTYWDTILRRPKTRVAKRLARRLHSRTEVVQVRGSVTDAAIVRRLLDSDIVVGCTDNHWSRMVLNGLAFQYYVPVIDLGVELQSDGALGGRVTWLAPGAACLWCLGILDAERIRVEQLPPAIRAHDEALGYIRGIEEPAPAIVSINGVIASMGVTELLARTTGFAGAARPGLLLYRLANGDVRRVATKPRLDCPTCSPRGLLGVGDLQTPPWLGSPLQTAT